MPRWLSTRMCATSVLAAVPPWGPGALQKSDKTSVRSSERHAAPVVPGRRGRGCNGTGAVAGGDGKGNAAVATQLPGAGFCDPRCKG